MSGPNINLKKEQLLFKEGEPSDGMYLIRKGEIVVYLEKNGNEVKLATLSAGAMLGEMAFFDKKPRSASAKALSDSEVTKISNEDFTKLLKQVPKWFVSLMTSLSTRLRETNERVQGLEAKMKAGSHPVQDLVRFLNVLQLLWHRDGIKDGKLWNLTKASTFKECERILGCDVAACQKYFAILEEGRIIQQRKDQYKADVVSIAHRAILEKLTEFISAFAKAVPDCNALPPDTVKILDCLNKVTQAQAYDSVNIAFEDVTNEALKNKVKTDGWNELLPLLKTPLEGLSIVKVSKGVGFKVTKKELPGIIDLYRVLVAVGQQK